MKTTTLLTTLFISCVALAEKPSLATKLTLPAKTFSSKVFSASTGGSEGTGGGDPCEDRIKNVRDDIRSWILNGGAKNLKLGIGMSVKSYEEKMLFAMESTKIECVGPGDKQHPVKVNGTAKVCRFDKFRSGSRITCDVTKFQGLGEADQYMLVHHEYAGIADIEKPDGDDSNYAVSNQISAYLVDQVVKRLAVKTLPPQGQWQEVRGGSGAVISQRFQDALSRTNFADCEKKLYGPAHLEEPNVCEGSRYWMVTGYILPKEGNKQIIERGWEDLPELADVVPHETGGVTNVKFGLFNCNGKGMAEYSQLFISRDTKSGSEVIKGQLYEFQMKTRGDTPKRVHLESTYYLDPTSAFVKKAIFRVGLFYKKNVGLPSSPKWVDDFMPIQTFACNSSNNSN